MLAWCQLCRYWRHRRLSYDNLQCRQWRQSWHHDDSCFSVGVLAIFMKYTQHLTPFCQRSKWYIRGLIWVLLCTQEMSWKCLWWSYMCISCRLNAYVRHFLAGIASTSTMYGASHTIGPQLGFIGLCYQFLMDSCDTLPMFFKVASLVLNSFDYPSSTTFSFTFAEWDWLQLNYHTRRRLTN